MMELATFVPETHAEREMGELANQIAELATHTHAATYRLLTLLFEFDENNGWRGWKSCAQWLSWRTRIALPAAREKVRVARALPGLPRISAAFAEGRISYSKVRAMTRIATQQTEESLLEIALHGTASHVEKVVRGYRRADPEREVALANRRHWERYVRTYHDESGNLVIEGKLPPELGARVCKALDAANDALRQASKDAESGRTARSTFGQRRADALVLLADSAVAAKLPGRRAADTHQVIVHVDAEVLVDPAADGRSELESGEHVSAETSRRLSCDSTVISVYEDTEGQPLAVGRSRRTVPPSIRRALNSRDVGCQFPGCHHTRFLEAHHIEHWANGGEAKLTNLVNLCSFHHRELHEGGFRIARDEGELKFITRDGSLVFRLRNHVNALRPCGRLLRVLCST